MKTVSLKLPESLDERLAAVAAGRSATKSAVMREALQEYLGRGKRVQAQSCLSLASDLVGSVDGPRDLSFRAKHLKGFGE